MKYQHIITEVCRNAWAILPEKFQAICHFLALSASGVKLTEEQVREAIQAGPRSRDISPQANAVAMIPVFGLISRRVNMMNNISGPGGTSTEEISQNLRRALADPKVSQILIVVDSPGGTVDGVPELSDEIYNARGSKKITAIADTMAASAAYWIASAADELIVTPSGTVGSIGVFASHQDISKALEKEGVNITMIRAGKYKTEGNPYEPLGEEARAHIQEEVDKYYEMFVGAVARNRGFSSKHVKENFGQGRMVMPDDAIANGMADDVATLDEMLAEMGVERKPMEMAAVEQPQLVAAIFPTLSPEGTIGSKSVSVTTPRSEAAAQRATKTSVNTPAKPDMRSEAMSTETTTAASAVEVKVDHAAEERERCQAIVQLAKRCGLEPSDVEAYIQSGTSLPDVKLAVGEMALARAKRDAKAGGLASPTVSALSEKERNDYSIRRVILSQMPDSNVEAGLEREISKAMAKDLGVESKGIFVPTQLRPQATGQDTKTNAAGKYLVATELRDLIDLLRNRAMVMKIGASVLGGLTSYVTFPRQLTATSASWVAENPGSDATQADGTFGLLTLSPKTLRGVTSYSRQLLIQSSLDVENRVRVDLATAHALAIDLAALDGTGTSNQPTGLLRTTNVGSVVIAASAGGAPTYAKVLELETNVSVANADSDYMKFLTTPEMRGKLKQIFTNATYGSIPVWQQVANAPGQGDCIGYPAFVSNQVPKTKTSGANNDCHCIILGSWDQLYIGEFGVMDLIVDPYALKKQGMIEVASEQMIDIGVRQPAMFAAIQDARNV